MVFSGARFRHRAGGQHAHLLRAGGHPQPQPWWGNLAGVVVKFMDVFNPVLTSMLKTMQVGDIQPLERLKLAITYKQKAFVAHSSVQQLLASIWYEGLPGFRRKNVFRQVCLLAEDFLSFIFQGAWLFETVLCLPCEQHHLHHGTTFWRWKVPEELKLCLIPKPGSCETLLWSSSPTLPPTCSSSPCLPSPPRGLSTTWSRWSTSSSPTLRWQNSQVRFEMLTKHPDGGEPQGVMGRFMGRQEWKGLPSKTYRAAHHLVGAGHALAKWNLQEDAEWSRLSTLYAGTCLGGNKTAVERWLAGVHNCSVESCWHLHYCQFHGMDR